MDSFVPPLQGWYIHAIAIPRAVPWADLLRPLRGRKPIRSRVFDFVLADQNTTLGVDPSPIKYRNFLGVELARRSKATARIGTRHQALDVEMAVYYRLLTVPLRRQDLRSNVRWQVSSASALRASFLASVRHHKLIPIAAVAVCFQQLQLKPFRHNGSFMNWPQASRRRL